MPHRSGINLLKAKNLRTVLSCVSVPCPNFFLAINNMFLLGTYLIF